MKRFVGVVVALTLLPAGTATAQQGAPDLDVNENPALVKRVLKAYEEARNYALANPQELKNTLVT